RPDRRRDRGVLGEHGVPHPQWRMVRGVDGDERRADAVVRAVRSVSVRPADDDRVARGDLLAVLGANQTGPPVRERPRAIRHRIRGQHQGRARGRAPPREDRPHPRGDARPVHADRESARRRAGSQARHQRRNREGRVERTDDAALRRLTTYSRRVLSVAEAARAMLAKLPRLQVERVAIDDARGRVLAENIVATRALPGFDNSAMDGLGGAQNSSMFLTEANFTRPAFRLRTRMRSTMRIITIALLTALAALAPANAHSVRFHDAQGRVTGSARTDANGVTTFRGTPCRMNANTGFLPSTTVGVGIFPVLGRAG